MLKNKIKINKRRKMIKFIKKILPLLIFFGMFKILLQ
ncbi:hypothetical protein N561_04920 [Gallibacterium anatis 12656/12]|uniref:Uncharacterized protein n=1 Tax=Gallibacterium anatis 12656/12 TaxID=1195244 RepID=U1H1R8_9PAST|nr:hypothetical protein N561_04920 [Gallibacterium anatis 12656/12]